MKRNLHLNIGSSNYRKKNLHMKTRTENSPGPVPASFRNVLVKISLVVTAAALLGSCASDSGYDSSGSGIGAVAPGEGMARRKAFSESYMAPPSAGSRSAMTTPEPAKRRPGLGTSLGDRVYDNTEGTVFYRRHPSMPDAIASFHYNDEEGAKAMAELLGKYSKGSGSFTLAGGKLKARLVPSWGSNSFPYYKVADKLIVAGQSGSSYRIELTNTTSQRIEVVVSVDGLDVRSGGAASFSKRGYVIKAKGSVSIDGMKGADGMRRFVFSSVSNSQASKVGGEKGARNVGVVGLAVFVEDEAEARLARMRETFIRDDAQAFPGS